MATYEFTLTDYQHPCPGVSPESQVWLNRGFIWMFAFGHEEAIRCFEKALDADPANLMAMWGVAICQSPNYNNPEMDEAQSKKAVEFIGKMRKAIAKGGHGDADVGMATALMSRFGGWPADKDDRARLDKAYADEMRKVAAAHPSDPDVLCITAEAIMQCNPWKLWVNGVAIAEVPELTSLLETGLKIAPNHPGLCHFYIPCGGPIANTRAGRWSSARQVHMPSHIDVLVGHYAEAIKSNEDAVIVDRKYKALRGGGDFYTLYASMFAGNEAKALAAANEMADELTPSVLEGEMADWLETFAAVPWHVLVRFGRWDTILAKPLPTDPTLYAATTTLGLYARTLALAALCRVDDAVAERDKFRAAKERLPSSRMLFNNSAVDMAAIADKMVDGELAYRQEDYETAFTALREAVALDDGLIYDEPWGWMQPARHALGALLMEQGRRDEAERVYRADLQWPRHPRNVWALHGLAECLRTGPASPEASKEYNEIKAILEEQQRGADVEIKASCFCRLSALKE